MKRYSNAGFELGKCQKRFPSDGILFKAFGSRFTPCLLLGIPEAPLEFPFKQYVCSNHMPPCPSYVLKTAKCCRRFFCSRYCRFLWSCFQICAITRCSTSQKCFSDFLELEGVFLPLDPYPAYLTYFFWMFSNSLRNHRIRSFRGRVLRKWRVFVLCWIEATNPIHVWNVSEVFSSKVYLPQASTQDFASTRIPGGGDVIPLEVVNFFAPIRLPHLEATKNHVILAQFSAPSGSPVR